MLYSDIVHVGRPAICFCLDRRVLKPACLPQRLLSVLIGEDTVVSPLPKGISGPLFPSQSQLLRKC